MFLLPSRLPVVLTVTLLFFFFFRLGVRRGVTPGRYPGIVICPLIPVLARGLSCVKALYRRLIYHFSPDGVWPKRARSLFLLYLFLLWRGPSSERALLRGPSYDFPLSHSWRAALAAHYAFAFPALLLLLWARGLSSERALRRRPSSHFPFCLISALPALCVSALHGRGDAQLF